jgi:hypothetical protein
MVAPIRLVEGLGGGRSLDRSLFQLERREHGRASQLVQDRQDRWQVGVFRALCLDRNEMFFLPTFKQADITYNDIMAGFYSGIAWRDKTLIPYVDALIPYSEASEPGDVSVYFDVRFGRRMSDSTNYQNTFASGKVTAAYFISDDWRMEANASIRGRWYEDYNGEKRTDIRPSASLALTWTPDWLKKIVKRGELSLNLEYYRNYSNIIDKNYAIWELGPTLSLRTKF